MIGDATGINWGSVAAVIIALVLFGIGYNLFTAWCERRHYITGYSSLFVALGVLVTLGGVAIISWQAALLALGAFVASGSPMIAGSIWRHVTEREKELARLREEAKHGN